jgi:hypothetical protein
MIRYSTALLTSNGPSVDPRVELELVLRLELLVVQARPAEDADP